VSRRYLYLVTQGVLQQLLAQPFVQQRYYISDPDGRTFFGWYGVVLLIDRRIHVSHLSLINFRQSTMGRRLVLAELKLDQNEILRIGTVHLESLNSRAQRLDQLNICQSVFTRSPGTYILMGDFNFSADGQENTEKFNALTGWIDVWAHTMGGDNHGYTFDTQTNAMTRASSGGPDRSRYDRVILRSQSIIPTQIEILGNKPVGHHEHLEIFPSDHFGLTAAFENKK
jgi:endonuclease/exonuclease/phosphatase family metal-dependent hydrolase